MPAQPYACECLVIRRGLHHRLSFIFNYLGKVVLIKNIYCYTIYCPDALLISCQLCHSLCTHSISVQLLSTYTLYICTIPLYVHIVYLYNSSLCIQYIYTIPLHVYSIFIQFLSMYISIQSSLSIQYHCNPHLQHHYEATLNSSSVSPATRSPARPPPKWAASVQEPCDASANHR